MADCHPVDTPMAAGATEFMAPYDKQASNDDIEVYGPKVGSLMYLAVQTRYDIAYAVSVLPRFLSNPSPQHIKAANRILQYLQGTKLLGVEFARDENANTRRKATATQISQEIRPCGSQYLAIDSSFQEALCHVYQKDSKRSLNKQLKLCIML